MPRSLNDLQIDALSPKEATDIEVAMTTLNNEYSLAIPEGTTGLRMRLNDAATAWRYSFTTGKVATAANATPITAGGVLEIPGPIAATTIYFACGASTKVMRGHFLARRT